MSSFHRDPKPSNAFGIKWGQFEATAYGIMGIIGAIVFIGLLAYGLR